MYGYYSIKVDYSNKQTYLEWARDNSVLSAENIIAPVQSGAELSMLDFAPTPLGVGGSAGKGLISKVVQSKWFKMNVLSVNETALGGKVITLGGKIKYVGTHAPKLGEIFHSRQIEIFRNGKWEVIKRW